MAPLAVVGSIGFPNMSCMTNLSCRAVSLEAAGIPVQHASTTRWARTIPLSQCRPFARLQADEWISIRPLHPGFAPAHAELTAAEPK
jgi:hypothetical protein